MENQYDTDLEGASPIKLNLTARAEGEQGNERPTRGIKSKPMLQTVTCHKAMHMTVLIVGPSGTGKTTFVNVVQNQQYTADAKIASETKDAYENELLLSIGGKFVMLKVIDTPGFGDTEGRSNLELENLILKFVKSNVTQINMVLVTIPFGKRIDRNQGSDILDCLDWLGPELRSITALLATHAEFKSPEQKKTWYDDISHEEHTKRIVQFCKGGTFFTGMSVSDDPVRTAQFERFQQREISRIVSKCQTNQPVKLQGEKFQKRANKFLVFESAAKDSLTLLRILPELQKLCVEAIQMRQTLINLNGKVRSEQKDSYGKAMNQLKEISQEEVDKNVMEWSKFQTAVEKYVGEGNRLSEASHGAMGIFIKLTTVLKEAKNLKFDIENLTEDDEVPQQDGESDDVDADPFGFSLEE